MKRGAYMKFRLGIVFLLLTPLVAQQKEPEPRMPDGSSRRLTILKSDAKRSKEDIEKLIALAHELREDIERNEYHVVDLGAIRKTEEIEKLVKRIRGRMKRVQ